MKCTECNARMIDGYLYHEDGCWNGVECRECGDNVRKGETCSECMEPVEDEPKYILMTFGTLPTFEKFSEAFSLYVPGITYTIRAGKWDCTVISPSKYTAEELFDTLERLTDAANRENGEETDDYAELCGTIASSILQTLYFEWV